MMRYLSQQLWLLSLAFGVDGVPVNALGSEVAQQARAVLVSALRPPGYQ